MLYTEPFDSLGKVNPPHGVSASKTITAENMFTDAIYLYGEFNIMVWGTFVATVVVQRYFEDIAAWLDVGSEGTYTTVAQEVGNEPEAKVLYRIGVKTGGYSSGTANVRIGQ